MARFTYHHHCWSNVIAWRLPSPLKASIIDERLLVQYQLHVCQYYSMRVSSTHTVSTIIIHSDHRNFLGNTQACKLTGVQRRNSSFVITGKYTTWFYQALNATWQISATPFQTVAFFAQIVRGPYHQPLAIGQRPTKACFPRLRPSYASATPHSPTVVRFKRSNSAPASLATRSSST